MLIHNVYDRVCADIDLNAVEHNFESMHARLKAGTKMMGVIKSDAYGHGAIRIAKLMEPKTYMWGFALATMEEALELRSIGITKPLLVLGYTFPSAYRDMIREHVRTAVFTYEMAELISEEAVNQGKTAYFHIKVDTGMGRIGMQPIEENVELVKKIAALPNVKVEGIFTHFAKADEYDKTYAYEQLRKFKNFVALCEDAGIKFDIRHCSNSAGIMEMPEANMDCVRAGITMYGLWPSDEVDKNALDLKPVMTLRSHIAYIKDIEPGMCISYGGTWTAEKPTRIATVPVGYADGYARQLSNKAYVLINGKKAPVRGRVCMDQMMVDVTDIPEAEEGMRVILFGEDHGSRITVEELGELSGRFNYEFVCDINKRVPRRYLYEMD